MVTISVTYVGQPPNPTTFDVSADDVKRFPESRGRIDRRVFQITSSRP